MKSMSVMVLVAISLAACGGQSDSDNTQLPVGAIVRVFPEIIDWTISDNSACYSAGLYNDSGIAIRVEDSNGSPIGNVKLTIMADLSSNTSPFQYIQIYRDVNGNGVIDSSDQLVTSNISPAYEVITDRYSGQALVLARANLSCTYAGNITAFAQGALGGATNIKVHLPE